MMLKPIVLLISVTIFLTGCNIELKRSANNKLFDTKGFEGGKRRPVYNGKYIDRAKRNIVENNYEDEEIDIEEPDEYVDPYTRNRIMYSNMIKEDKSKKRGRKSLIQTQPDQSYPDIGHAKDLALSQGSAAESNQALRAELAEIKTMLSTAKKDLAKYKCPLQTEPENIRPAANSAKAPPITSKPQHKKAATIVEDEKDELDYAAPEGTNEQSLDAAPASESVKMNNQSQLQDSHMQQNSGMPSTGPAPALSHAHDDEIVDELPSAMVHQTSAPAASPPAAAPTPPPTNMINLAPVK